MLTPILSRRLLLRLYRHSEYLHGKPFLDVDTNGIQFGGEKSSVKTAGHPLESPHAYPTLSPS